MPKTAKIIVSSDKEIKSADHKELLRNARAKETPKGKGGKIRQRLVDAFKDNFVGVEPGDEYSIKAAEEAALRGGFKIFGKGKERDAKKRQKSSPSYFLRAPEEATLDKEKYHLISTVSAENIQGGKESVEVFYDLAAMVKELQARGMEASNDVNEEWVLDKITLMMKAKAGTPLKGIDRKLIEIIAPFILIRFEAKQSFIMSESGIADLYDDSLLAEVRPFYYNHSTDLRKDPDREFFTAEKKGGIFNRNPGRELREQNIGLLKERFKATVGLQIRAASSKPEGCFIAEPNEFFSGLAPNERKKAQKLFLEAAIEAISDFQKNPRAVRTPIFLQSSVADKSTDLRGAKYLHVVRDFNPAHFDAFRADGADGEYMVKFNLTEVRIAQQVMASNALGVFGESIVVNSTDIDSEQTEANLLLQAPMIACVVGPQNNLDLRRKDWLIEHAVDVSLEERKKAMKKRPPIARPSQAEIRAEYGNEGALYDEAEEAQTVFPKKVRPPQKGRAAVYEYDEAEEFEEPSEMLYGKKPGTYEQPAQAKFKLLQSSIVIKPTARRLGDPSQDIEVVMARPLDGSVVGKARSVAVEAFRFIPSIYQTDPDSRPDQHAIIDTFFNIIALSAAEAGISPKEALGVIKYAQEKGGTSDLGGDKARAYKNFSGYCQEHAGKCGLYTHEESISQISGDKGGLGCRLNSFPQEAIDQYQRKKIDDKTLRDAKEIVLEKEKKVTKLVGPSPVAVRSR